MALPQLRQSSLIDLKSAWYSRTDKDAVAYRPECFSCEFYRQHILGGLKIDGREEPRWSCVLVHERKQRCKFESESKPTSVPSPGPTSQAVEPRLPSDQVGKPLVQPQPPGEDLPSRPKLDPPNPEKLKTALPDLPKVETKTPGRHPSKRTRR